jgi:Glycosyl transferase family 2
VLSPPRAPAPSALVAEPDARGLAEYLAQVHGRAVVRCPLPASGAEAALAALAAPVADGAIAVVTAEFEDEAALRARLRRAGLRAAFAGRTLADNFLRERSVALAVVDARLGALLDAPPAPPAAPPLAVIATYNDADVIAQLARHHLASGLDLHLIDNWSSDGTYDLLLGLARAHAGRVTVERWPADGPADEYRWTELLRRKAEIGSAHRGRWIVHVDSDEAWRSPWPELSLAEAFGAAERYGANAVGASMFTFVPTRDGFGANDDPHAFFTAFTYPPHDAYDQLLRAWRQPEHPIELAASGGHEAAFATRRVFPYRFPLFHYPFRSEAQGFRKVYRERLPRFVRAERERGWHTHYTELPAGERFLTLPQLAHRYDPARFGADYLVETISDAVLRRRRGSLMA